MVLVCRLNVAIITTLKDENASAGSTREEAEGSETESLLEKVQHILEDEKGVRWLDEQTTGPLAISNSESREPNSPGNSVSAWLLETADNEQFDERLGQLSLAQILAALPAPPPALNVVPGKGTYFVVASPFIIIIICLHPCE